MIRKIVTAGVIALALTSCGVPLPRDAALRTYSGPARVDDQDEYGTYCELKLRLLKNGQTTHVQRAGRNSCPEREGDILMFIGGKKV